AAADTDALRRAAGCFRGELLEGLDLPDCYGFHEWCVGEREAARGLRLAILGTLVERLKGDPDEALRHARSRVAIDPLTEAGHVALVRLLGELGKTRDAIRQYETCRRILANELHSAPSVELERARAALQPLSAASAPATAAPAPAVE